MTTPEILMIVIIVAIIIIFATILYLRTAATQFKLGKTYEVACKKEKSLRAGDKVFVLELEYLNTSILYKGIVIKKTVPKLIGEEIYENDTVVFYEEKDGDKKSLRFKLVQ